MGNLKPTTNLALFSSVQFLRFWKRLRQIAGLTFVTKSLKEIVLKIFIN